VLLGRVKASKSGFGVSAMPEGYARTGPSPGRPAPGTVRAIRHAVAEHRTRTRAGHPGSPTPERLPMRIEALTVIGTGYLGATHAAAMAESGYEVLGVDVDAAKVAALARGEVPFFEPGSAGVEPGVPARGVRRRRHPDAGPDRDRRGDPAGPGEPPTRDEEVMRRVYAPMIAWGSPFLVMDYATAELVKVAANAFLATKISFINAMAEVCEATGADVTPWPRRSATTSGSAQVPAGRPRLRRRLPAQGHPGLHGPRRRARRRPGADVPAREVDAINLRRRARMVDLAREASSTAASCGMRIGRPRRGVQARQRRHPRQPGPRRRDSSESMPSRCGQRHRDADHRQRGDRGEHPRQVRGPAGPGDDHRSPRPAAERPYSSMSSGMRCAETTSTSCGTPNSRAPARRPPSPASRSR
jgi:hypothetical protein